MGGVSMEWKEVRLGEVADVQTGPFGSQLHKENYVNKGTPIVTVEHLGNKWFTSQNLPMVSDEDKLRLAKYCSQEGDVIFSRVGSVDRCSYVSKEYSGWLFSGRCLRVRPRSGINPEYLYYFLTNEGTKQYIRNIAVGATMPSINTKLLNEVPITIPSLDDQHRIASILSSLDRKIELNNKINADLEEMAQAIFKNWFVDFEPFKDGKFVDSELGMIPEGWKVGCLGDMGAVVCGKTPSKSNSNYYGGDIPFIKIPDMHGNVFVENSEDRLTEEGSLSQIKKLIPPYSLMVSCIATVGLVSINTKPSHTNQQINTVIPHNKSALFYLYQHIKNNEEFLKNMGRGGTTTLNVNTKSFSNIRLLIPSEIALEQFHGIVEGLFKKIEQNLHESRTLSLLRDTLLPRLMSGELEVPE